MPLGGLGAIGEESEDTFAEEGEDSFDLSGDVSSNLMGGRRSGGSRLSTKWRTGVAYYVMAPLAGAAMGAWCCSAAVMYAAATCMGYCVQAVQRFCTAFGPKVDIDGCIALVTGGSLGIGEAVAKALAQKGCTVVIWGRDLDNLRRVQLDIRDAGGKCLYYTCDLAKRENVLKAADLMLKDVGEPDIVVLNAGIASGWPIASDSDELQDKAMAVNLSSNLWMVKRFWPGMQARGYGHFVLVSSQSALSQGNLYGITKAGQMMLAEGIRADAIVENTPGVSASSYIVGFVDTPMVKGMGKIFGGGPGAMLSVEEAANDILWMIENRVMHCFNPFWAAFKRTLLAHQPHIFSEILEKLACGVLVHFKQAKAKLEAAGEELGHPLSYKLRTVEVTRRLSMYKRSQKK